MAIGRFYLMKPTDIFSLYGDVSIGGGAVDSDYQAAWLVDGRVGRPVRATGGSLTFTITNGSFTPGSLPTPVTGHDNKTLIVLANTNLITPATITVSGDVSGSITVPATQPNDVGYSPYLLATYASLSTVTVAVASNIADVIIGEALYGTAIELWPPPAPRDQSIQWNDFKLDAAVGEFGSVQPYYRGIESRTLSFTQYYNRTMLDELIKAQRSQRAGEKPLVIVPNSSINDAWVVYMDPVKYSVYAGGGGQMFKVDLSFTEYPRSTW